MWGRRKGVGVRGRGGVFLLPPTLTLTFFSCAWVSCWCWVFLVGMSSFFFVCRGRRLFVGGFFSFLFSFLVRVVMVSRTRSLS